MIKMQFDPAIAKIVGTDAAIILSNIRYWIEKNKKHGKHFYDGKYWTYNSKRAYLDTFNYLSEQAIKTCLNKLKKEGFLVTGYYNKKAFDRTLWYTIDEVKINQCIGGNQPMEKLESTNQLDSSNQPIPDKNTDNKPDNNQDASAPEKHPLILWMEKEKFDKVLTMEEPLTFEQCVKLTDQFPKGVIADVIRNMQNKKRLKQDYISTYLTALNWCKRRMTDLEPETQPKPEYIPTL